jgi:hypothetical protein
MTIRLSMSSLAGTERTLVAVGTARLDAMFVTVLAAAPRSLVTSASTAAGGGEADPLLEGALGEPEGPGGAAGAGSAATGAGLPGVPGVGLKSEKKLHQARSTDDGSAR